MRAMDLCVYLIEINVVINFHQRFLFLLESFSGDFRVVECDGENLNRKIDKNNVASRGEFDICQIMISLPLRVASL